MQPDERLHFLAMGQNVPDKTQDESDCRNATVKAALETERRRETPRALEQSALSREESSTATQRCFLHSLSFHVPPPLLNMADSQAGAAAGLQAAGGAAPPGGDGPAHNPPAHALPGAAGPALDPAAVMGTLVAMQQSNELMRESLMATMNMQHEQSRRAEQEKHEASQRGMSEASAAAVRAVRDPNLRQGLTWALQLAAVESPLDRTRLLKAVSEAAVEIADLDEANNTLEAVTKKMDSLSKEKQEELFKAIKVKKRSAAEAAAAAASPSGAELWCQRCERSNHVYEACHATTKASGGPCTMYMHPSVQRSKVARTGGGGGGGGGQAYASGAQGAWAFGPPANASAGFGNQNAAFGFNQPFGGAAAGFYPPAGFGGAGVPLGPGGGVRRGCFNCGQFGHHAFQCPSGQQGRSGQAGPAGPSAPGQAPQGAAVSVQHAAEEPGTANGTARKGAGQAMIVAHSGVIAAAQLNVNASISVANASATEQRPLAVNVQALSRPEERAQAQPHRQAPTESVVTRTRAASACTRSTAMQVQREEESIASGYARARAEALETGAFATTAGLGPGLEPIVGAPSGDKAAYAAESRKDTPRMDSTPTATATVTDIETQPQGIRTQAGAAVAAAAGADEPVALPSIEAELLEALVLTGMPDKDQSLRRAIRAHFDGKKKLLGEATIASQHCARCGKVGHTDSGCPDQTQSQSADRSASDRWVRGVMKRTTRADRGGESRPDAGGRRAALAGARCKDERGQPVGGVDQTRGLAAQESRVSPGHGHGRGASGLDRLRRAAQLHRRARAGGAGIPQPPLSGGGGRLRGPGARGWRWRTAATWKWIDRCCAASARCRWRSTRRRASGVCARTCAGSTGTCPTSSSAWSHCTWSWETWCSRATSCSRPTSRRPTTACPCTRGAALPGLAVARQVLHAHLPGVRPQHCAARLHQDHAPDDGVHAQPRRAGAGHDRRLHVGRAAGQNSGGARRRSGRCCRQLGWTLNAKCVWEPADEVLMLGMLVNTREFLVRAPDKKIRAARGRHPGHSAIGARGHHR